MSRVVAIIPARGGSKRIPRKNVKAFHGKPLIAYSIEVALSSKLFDDVIVSTDDKEIADIAQRYGARVPFIRPKELSDDYTGTGSVISHTLEYLKDQGEVFDYCCTLYATAPLLKIEYLIEGFKKLKESDAKNSFSVISMPFPIQRTFRITQENRCEMFWPEHFNKRSQDLEVAYQDAGQFYFSKLNEKPNECMFSSESVPIVIPRYLVQDIDTVEDWVRAEVMYEVIKRENY